MIVNVLKNQKKININYVKLIVQQQPFKIHQQSMEIPSGSSTNRAGRQELLQNNIGKNRSGPNGASRHHIAVLPVHVAHPARGSGRHPINIGNPFTGIIGSIGPHITAFSSLTKDADDPRRHILDAYLNELRANSTPAVRRGATSASTPRWRSSRALAPPRPHRPPPPRHRAAHNPRPPPPKQPTRRV